jgi:hypothetical protein
MLVSPWSRGNGAGAACDELKGGTRSLQIATSELKKNVDIIINTVYNNTDVLVYVVVEFG